MLIYVTKYFQMIDNLQINVSQDISTKSNAYLNKFDSSNNRQGKFEEFSVIELCLVLTSISNFILFIHQHESKSGD